MEKNKIIKFFIFAGLFYLIGSLKLAKVFANEPGQISCKKLGINYAIVGPVANNQHDRAASHKLGYTLEMMTAEGQEWGVSDSFKYALDHGMTPILRICYGNTCGFTDPVKYAVVLDRIADLVGGRTFYAIAGPNEPISETWLGGNPGEWWVIAPLVTTYMNQVIAHVTRPNVKLLSPAFNLTHPNLNDEVTTMVRAGAQFDKLAGIAGNGYNLKGYVVDGVLRETISSQVSRLRSVASNVFANQDIYLTEIGMFESDQNPAWSGTKVPRSQALINLKDQIEIMRLDPKIKGFLLFDSFGTNPDQGFAYNFMTDAEIDASLSGLCFLPRDVDLDGTGGLTADDIKLQIANWIFPANLRADTNGSGSVNSFDFGLLNMYWKN